MKSICIFCGSSPGKSPIYKQSAIELAQEMLKRNYQLVYGGANVGIMGFLANHFITNNGHVVGVMPKFLDDVEISHPNITELHIVNTMHERKQMLSAISDAFIMLPGGAGSFEEFFEVWTWMQLGLQVKPLAILNTNGYYDLLLQFLDHSVEEGFTKERYKDKIIVSSDPSELLDQMASFSMDLKPKWLDVERIT